MKIYGLIFFIAIAVPFTSTTAISSPKATFSYRLRGCASNYDCSNTSVCHNEVCVDVCHHKFLILNKGSCAENARCVITKPHTAECLCKPGFRGDPYGTKCKKPIRLGDY